MAEAILSNLAKKLLEGLGSLLVQEIGLASGVRKELRKLEESLSHIKAILSDAEKKGAMNDVVKDWLRKLKDVAYDAEDVLDELATEVLRQKVELPNNNMVVKQVRRCFSRSNPLLFRLKMGHRIKDIIERLDRIQKDNLYSTFQSLPDENVDRDMYDEDRRHTDPYVIESVLGRDNDREYVVELLLSSGGGSNTSEDVDVMVIPIIGIGGLGKTTLAQYVYNDERVEKHFESRMWVCVSLDFDVVKLAKKILEALTNDKKCDDLGGNQAKSQLVEKLLGKRYLLVLDDVWNNHAGKWENLRKLLIGGGRGSMILVTTRSEEVASIMQPIKVSYPLKGLDENDCESLFNERAFGGRKVGKEVANRYPELVEIGKGIVKKCGGVPLAAKALGSLLRLNRNINDWFNVLNTEIWNLAGEHEILPALRISYDQLPSHLKQCFAYCSLFPQDDLIFVDDLIHQWMAHGFIQPPPPSNPLPRLSSSSSLGGSHIESLEDIGNRYFRELLWRSFFQEVEEDGYGNIWRCKMHDLVHNLARWVAGLEWSEVVLDSSPSSRTSCTSRVRHMVQFYDGKARDHSTNTHPLPLEKPQKLRTLRLEFTEYPPPSWLAISAGFVSNLRGLRVLNLSSLGMKHVPSSIGYLEQLRYLDLSWNNFKALPNSICRLYNLQTLRLEECRVFYKWPRDMTKMVSLRHLGLEMNESLEYMPRGMGQLTSLRRLGIFVVDDPNNTRRRGRISGGLGELHGLNQLGGSLSIKGLGNVRDARDGEEAKLKEKSQLQDLEFHFGSSITNRQGSLDDEQVLGNLEPHPSLKVLTIVGYQGVKMPRWMIIPSPSLLLSNLAVLNIDDCSNLKCLPLIGEFPRLRTLSLLRLDALKSICNIVVVGGGEALPLFPSLQRLTLNEFPNLKRWTINPSSSVEATTTMTTVEEEEEEEEEEEAQHNNNQFHFLSSMFPRLTHLSFYGCPKLTRVPLLSVAGIQHLTSLQTLSIDGLERLVSLPDCPAPATLQRLEIYNCPRLVRLPDRFFENLKLLSWFKIWNCGVQLTSLPEGIQHLAALEMLNIYNCPALTTLPMGLGNITSLQQLHIQDCPNLLSLPKGIQHLTALKYLLISGLDGVEQLPEGLGNLTALERLSISKLDGLNQLPENLGNLITLEELFISELNGIDQLPESLGNLTALKLMSISKLDCINQLPKSLGNLTILEGLSISKLNGVNQLPENLGNLITLKRLCISELNGINQLPESLGNLTALENLCISELDGINQLPEILGNFTALEELCISKLNGINQLPESLGNLIALKRLVLWKLDGVNELPENLGNLITLKELFIGELNGINQLPENLGNLVTLKKLIIGKLHGVNQLPESLGNLTSLEELCISDFPHLSSLPKGIQHTALNKLIIESCPALKTLPEVLGNLTSLKELYINACPHLSSLPKGIQQLTALENLRIQRCPGLKALPQGLGSLSSLKKLHIEDCSNLSSLPKGLGHLIALEHMSIENCPGLRALPDGLEILASHGGLLISNCPNLSPPRDLRLLLTSP